MSQFAQELLLPAPPGGGGDFTSLLQGVELLRDHPHGGPLGARLAGGQRHASESPDCWERSEPGAQPVKAEPGAP